MNKHFSPITLLSMSMQPEPMLRDAAGRARTVIETLEAGDYEAVLAIYRWQAIPPDVNALRITDRPVITTD